jgi:hypothetical protein
MTATTGSPFVHDLAAGPREAAEWTRRQVR